MDYKKLKIKSYKHWDLYLHENQCYLGRTFVQLKEEDGVDDFLSIEGEVRDEFSLIGEEVKAALKTLFQPDNSCLRLHESNLALLPIDLLCL